MINSVTISTAAMILYYVAVMLLAWRRRNLFLGVALFVATMAAAVLVQDRFMQTQLAQNVAASAASRTEAEDVAVLWIIGAVLATMRILALIIEWARPWGDGEERYEKWDEERGVYVVGIRHSANMDVRVGLAANAVIYFLMDMMMTVYFAVALADTAGVII